MTDIKKQYQCDKCGDIVGIEYKWWSFRGLEGTKWFYCRCQKINDCHKLTIPGFMARK